ncbi:hypothetical protein DM02DRAFT_648698 [Periconia macrospinosa]|uniref:Uncharacterized protein n=1 Tax=Periconia macrospinosa TaxID=97972 RepID=A0A2V1EAU0_9PLEO|nr:hypothetical protein DM02DRAFT_648698 [Periconia macrospinosa]
MSNRSQIITRSLTKKGGVDLDCPRKIPVEIPNAEPSDTEIEEDTPPQQSGPSIDAEKIPSQKNQNKQQPRGRKPGRNNTSQQSGPSIDVEKLGSQLNQNTPRPRTSRKFSRTNSQGSRLVLGSNVNATRPLIPNLSRSSGVTKRSTRLKKSSLLSSSVLSKIEEEPSTGTTVEHRSNEVFEDETATPHVPGAWPSGLPVKLRKSARTHQSYKTDNSDETIEDPRCWSQLIQQMSLRENTEHVLRRNIDDLNLPTMSEREARRIYREEQKEVQKQQELQKRQQKQWEQMCEEQQKQALQEEQEEQELQRELEQEVQKLRQENQQLLQQQKLQQEKQQQKNYTYGFSYTDPSFDSTTLSFQKRSSESEPKKIMINPDTSFNEILVYRSLVNFSFTAPMSKIMLPCTHASPADTMRLRREADQLNKYPESQDIMNSLYKRIERMVARQVLPDNDDDISTEKPATLVTSCARKIRDWLKENLDKRTELGENPLWMKHEIEWAEWFVYASELGVFHIKIEGCECSYLVEDRQGQWGYTGD